MRNLTVAAACAALFIALLTACSTSVSGREISIVQGDDACTPGTVSVTPGEKLKLDVKNESGNDAYEVEGIDGTQVEEFVVHSGKSKASGYTVPNAEGTYKLKCYVPGGVSTIIELQAGSAAAATSGASTPATGSGTGGPNPAITTEAGTPSGRQPDVAVAVSLVEYTVGVDKPEVNAGTVRFIATNVSKSQIHELAVLKIKPDGSLDNIGEVEAIDPQSGGSITLDLAPGDYQLACLITRGEAGSTVDHYQEGMHTAFRVD